MGASFLAGLTSGSKAILLVGGFGESEYLFQCLKAADYGIGLPIEVLQPPNG